MRKFPLVISTERESTSVTSSVIGQPLGGRDVCLSVNQMYFHEVKQFLLKLDACIDIILTVGTLMRLNESRGHSELLTLCNNSSLTTARSAETAEGLS